MEKGSGEGCNEVLNPELVDDKLWTDNVNIVPYVSQLCRICANESDRLIPIFEGEGIEHELLEKINQHLPLKVSEEDRLPKNVCYLCVSTLVAWHVMSVSCIEADKKLHSLIQDIPDETPISDEEFCNDDDQSMDVDDQDIDIAEDKAFLQSEPVKGSEEIKIVEVSTLKKTATSPSKSNVNKDLSELPVISEEVVSTIPESNEKSSDRVTNLETCVASTSASSDTAPTTSDADVIAAENPASETAEESIVSFKYCETEMLTKSSFKNENSVGLTKTKKNAKLKFLCDICNKIFKRKYDLQRHFDKCHFDKVFDADEGDSNCELTEGSKDECDGIRRSLFKDNETANKKIFTCETCSKCLKSKDSYNRHIRIHTNERPYLCHICEKSFRYRSTLMIHLRDVHERIRSVPCDLCDKKFANRATRDDHRRIHTGERPYVCSICGKAFKSKSTLYFHNKTHEDSLPYVCLVCGKGFNRRPELAKHNRTHTGEKPHVCDTCGKGFCVKSELISHLVVHSDKKPFTCFYCKVDTKSFKQKRYLKKHILKHHKRVAQESDFVTS